MRGAGEYVHEYLLELPSETERRVGGDGCTRYRAKVLQQLSLERLADVPDEAVCVSAL